MQLLRVDRTREGDSADVILYPFWEEKKKAVPAFPKPKKEYVLSSSLQEDFSGKALEHVLVYPSESGAKRIFLLGLGDKKECSLEGIRKAFAMAVQVLRKKKLKNVQVFLPENITQEKFSALIDGLLMANYTYDELKRETRKEASFLLEKIQLVGGTKELDAIVKKHQALIEAVNMARDLVNGNADEVEASHLASVATNLAKKHASLEVKILRKKELEKEKMGLLLAVNRAAVQEPALIVLRYEGDPKSKDWTAVVGKGITYDTGGLNLKPTGSMETMKCDMGGAASVLGLIQACTALKIKRNVLGVIASAENAVGPLSYKPGDVYISHSGKSVEISNTDAEGRLVLADALSYVQKHYKPDRIVDLATLTGGIVIALGEEACGLFSNHPKIASQLKLASENTGERIWEMPLYQEYKDALKSPIADIKNSSGRKASSGTGAAFLSLFIEKETPWAHLDIAGTAYLSETTPYHPTLATGFGVKLLYAFLENLS